MSRFFVPDLMSSRATGTVVLEGTEAHHALHVLRMKAGEELTLFDGVGHVALATVTSPGRKSVDCRLKGEIKTSPAPSPEITLMVAPPKGDRVDWLIEKATELGVTTLIPLSTTRSTVDPRDGKLERLRQTVVSACKQCHRDWLMKIREQVSLKELLSQPFSTPTWFGSLAEPPLGNSDPRSATPREPLTQLTILVGPEGGWTPDEEHRLLAQGALPVRLGSYVLRTETAAIALTAKALAACSA